MTKLRILLVDDEAATRKGLRMLLQFEPDIEIVGEAPNGLFALRQIELLSPDLVLLDVRMPGMDGLTCAREIGRRFPDVAVLFLSLYDDQASREEAASLGAADFVGKQAMAENLLPALQHLIQAS